MARVTKVDSCRKAQKCDKCGSKIKVGEPYLWWKFRFGGKRTRCMDAGCKPRPSDLTQSEFLGTYGDLEQAWNEIDASGGIDDAVSAAKGIADDIRTLGDDCQGKLDNMPEQLQYGDVGTLLQERVDGCKNLSSEIESAADEAESNGSEEELASEYDALKNKPEKLDKQQWIAERQKEIIEEMVSNVSWDVS